MEKSKGSRKKMAPNFLNSSVLYSNIVICSLKVLINKLPIIRYNINIMYVFLAIIRRLVRTCENRLILDTFPETLIPIRWTI